MIRKYVLPLLAVVGVIFALWLVVTSAKPVPYSQPLTEPAEAPFRNFVAGAGIIESSTENIAIATPLSGVVLEVSVKVGVAVKSGQPLFRLDDRSLKADLEVRRNTLRMAQEKLLRLKSLPRPEEIPPAQARVKEAEASLGDVKNQLALAESLTDRRAVSREEIDKRRFAVRVAETRLLQAQTNLALLKAGSWRPDIQVATAEVTQAEAQVGATQTDIERLVVRAPVDGQVLQLNVRPGEFAQAGVMQIPLLVLGNVSLLHIRTDVDEHDAWRVQADVPAKAFVRGNRSLSTPLQFVRVEPYIIPKRSLTGESTERVDTRVLQVIYSFERGSLPVYVGQQMDVFIEAPPIASGSGEGGSEHTANGATR